MMFYTVKIGKISECIPIIYCSPIWTGILGAIIYKEKFGIIEIMTSIFGVLGMIFIFKPPFILEIFNLNDSEP
jgi:drug/metabolite transporter (DMT)-like permease